MRTLSLLLFLFTTVAWAAEEIRSFPIATLQTLGRDLYQRDQLAAHAFDAVFEAHPEAKKYPLRGWVTQVDKEQSRVFIIQAPESQVSLAYVVNFLEGKPPVVEDQRGTPLPASVAQRYAAIGAAIKAITNFMAETYNFEVLDDPEQKGFLVYAIASTQNPNEVIVGGHYRIGVSLEGVVQRVDALSRSLLILPKNPEKAPNSEEPAMLFMTHIVSRSNSKSDS